jgi:hypothetical protein
MSHALSISDMEESGYIYKITCKATGKHYIGQAREYKHKHGKPYRYGIQGRWGDHVSSSKQSQSEFASAIRRYGKDGFTVEELEKSTLNNLDASEAKWISQYNSVVPHGYNTARHSQNKHRESSNIHEFFKGDVVNASLRKIHKGTQLSLVYVILTLKDSTQRRIVFGNNKDDTFERAWKDANTFVQKLDCPYSEDTSFSANPLERYAEKIQSFSEKQIIKIRITSASQLIAVYVTTSDTKSWKDQTRVCFGGKTICKEAAYELACLFVEQLPKTNLTVIEDSYRCPQQAADSTGEASP